MNSNDKTDQLKKMQNQLTWLLAQVEKCELGRPELATENGVYAAHKCSEMAAEYRQRANNLMALIATTEDAEA
jgi:hypothetical protein